MEKKSIRKYFLALGIIWTILVAIITYVFVNHIIQHTREKISGEALTIFNKDTATRYWASMHGGVYVPITEKTQPNPFLANVSERDITTPSGKKLTLMNPAYLLRQQMEEFFQLYGIKGHVTSLIHFRPETEPDIWERKALKEFEKGVKEVAEYSKIDNREYYRLMRPLIVNESCLKCHFDKGIKVGDIRGGVSISVPSEEYLMARDADISTIAVVNTLIWFGGIFLLFISCKKIVNKESERFEAQNQLEEQKKLLEETVEKRTEELKKSLENLKIEIGKKEKLKDKLQKSDKIINNSQAVGFIWRNEPNWPVEYVTQNVESILGYSAEEFITGKVVYSDIIHKGDLERISTEVDSNSNDSSSSNFTHKDYRLIKKSGKVIWVEDRTSIIRDENEEIIQYDGIIIDITQKKKLEEENEYKNEFERRIATISTYFVNLNVNDIHKALMFTTQSFGKFLEVERAYVALINENGEFGIKSQYFKNNKTVIPKNQIINIKNYNWLFFSLLKGKPVLIENSDSLGNLAINEKKMMDKLEIKSFLAIPIVINGNLLGFLGFDSKLKFGVVLKKHLSLFQLLTEIVTNLYSKYLNEYEMIAISDKNRSLIQAVEQSADSVIITDIDGNIEFVNSKFEELTGYNKSEIVGKNPRILKSDHTPLTEYENLWKTIKNGDIWKGQFKNIGKSGNVFWEKTTITPIKDIKGDITNFLAIKENVTEKILLENQRSLSQKMESIGLLAAGIAHEINTPMQYVGDNVNFLADSYGAMTSVFFDFSAFLKDEKNYNDTEIREYFKKKTSEMDLEFIFNEIPEALEQTKTGITHVTKIVRAMKDFAHPGSKEMTYFNLNSGIENTVTISKHEWKYIANIELNLDENLKEVLSLQDELNQVFLNMIVNSAHAIEEKRVKMGISELGKISISTIMKDENAIVKISDTGNGISNKNLNRIFDPFFTTKDVGKGTGQGLAIAHDIIVNKHSGNIFVDSEEGIGTTFTIELPINGKRVKE